jgi:hypothetical protein
MECMFLQQQPHTAACNVPPVNPFEFIGKQRHLLLIACWAGTKKGRPKYYSCCKTNEMFFWPTVNVQVWYVQFSLATSLRAYLHERCARKSLVFARIPHRLLESRPLMAWAYSDTINNVGIWQTSVECLLGDWNKTRNFWKSTYFFCENTWKLNRNQTQHLQ